MYNVCHSQLVNDSGGGGGKTRGKPKPHIIHSRGRSKTTWTRLGG